ncbi:hypothetical protein [Escherichia phage vB_EcoM_EP32a]|nr:hypothetical protein [Escherichia phage vB_EcoM_EP32a]
MNNHMAYLKEGHQEPTEGIEIFKITMYKSKRICYGFYAKN